jgi:UDP-glucose 4-epimerase
VALVTGGAGFIGSHVAERLAAEGYAVRVLDDLSSGERGRCAPAWSLLEGDVCDPEAVDAACAGASVVAHLAAFVSVADSFPRFRDCYRTNVLGTYRVLEACVRHGVGRVTFASSCAVYGERSEPLRSEDDAVTPASPYAVSKLEGEHLLEVHREAHGLGGVALRLFNVYGPRQRAASGYAAAVPAFLEAALAGGPLVIHGDGRQSRDFVYVEDVAEAFLGALRADVSGVFNVGTGRAVEILELADAVARLVPAAAERRFEERRPGDLRAATADPRRAAEVLEWRAGVGLEDGLARTLEALRSGQG